MGNIKSDLRVFSSFSNPLKNKKKGERKAKLKQEAPGGAFFILRT
jgi:hypothetical protein